NVSGQAGSMKSHGPTCRNSSVCEERGYPGVLFLTVFLGQGFLSAVLVPGRAEHGAMAEAGVEARGMGYMQGVCMTSSTFRPEPPVGHRQLEDRCQEHREFEPKGKKIREWEPNKFSE
uniref:Uncharacterized protein n=1 Tax=Pavo cristatus TaxID=9049 RepID=A0A8C9G1P5_PAVCR